MHTLLLTASASRERGVAIAKLEISESTARIGSCILDSVHQWCYDGVDFEIFEIFVLLIERRDVVLSVCALVGLDSV